MGELKKKLFDDKRYQRGYNNAMNIAFERERELQDQIEYLQRNLDDMTGMYRVASEHRMATYMKVQELQEKIEKMFTKKEIRAVLIEDYWHAADPSAQVDLLIQAMVRNKQKGTK